MSQAIDQARVRDLANPPEVVGINGIDVASLELRRSIRHGVEHLVVAIEVMD